MKKVFSLIVIFSLLCTTLVLAGGSQETAETGDTMEVVTWASWALAEESLKPIYMSMIEEFMRQNPDIKVETVAYPYAQYKDQIIISAAAGNAPDVVHIKEEWVPPLMGLDALLPLDDYMDPQARADFFPEILGGVTYNGSVMCMPWFNNPYALYYNKTLMEKAGVDSLPQDLNELFEAARKISALGADENGNKIYGYLQPNSKTEPGVGYNFFPVMWGFGGKFTNADGSINIYSPENIKAFKTAKALYDDDISPNGATFKDARNLFAQGVIGFYYDIEMAAAPINAASPKGDAFSEEYSTTVIPQENGPDGYGYLIQHHNVVFKSCEHKAAAVKLAEFLAGPEVLQILYDAGMGKMPARKSVLDMEIFTNPAKSLSKAFINAMPTARPLPTGAENFMLAEEAIADALTLLTITDDSVETVVKDLDVQIKELYGQD